jgi:hypothetical protein
MAKNELTDAQFNKLVAAVKKNPEMSGTKLAEETGLDLSEVYSNLFYAELEADPSLAIKPTAANIRNAVEKGLYRWPRLAVYAGISTSQAKKLYTEATGKAAPSNITNRGRQFDGNGKAKPKAETTRGQSGRRGAAAKKEQAAGAGTSGRRGAAAKKEQATGKAAAPAGRGRRGTRAAANPR